MSTFKRFLQYYKPYKGIFFMDLFCALIMCIVDLSFPLIPSFLLHDFLDLHMYLLHTILFLTLTYFPPYAPTIIFTRPLDKTSQTKKYKPNNTVNTITKPLDDINSLNVGHLTVFNSLNTFDGEYVDGFSRL